MWKLTRSFPVQACKHPPAASLFSPAFRALGSKPGTNVTARSSLGGPKGVKPPEAFGERWRDCSLGHAGDEGPHLSMTAEELMLLNYIVGEDS